MNIIWLQITNLIYIILLIIVYFSKNRLHNMENEMYKYLLFSNLFGLMIELSCFYTVSHIDTMPLLNTIFTKSLLVYYLGFILLFNYYVFIVVFNKDDVDKQELKNKLEKVKNVSIILFVINAIILYVLPMSYSTGKHIYSYGLSVDYVNVIYVIAITVWIVLLLKNYKNIKTKKYLPIIIFIVLAGIVGQIQRMYPYLTFATVIETFVVFLMFFTIENPDMRMIAELNKAKKQMEFTNSDKSKFLFNITEDVKKTIEDVNDIANIVIENSNEEETKEEMYKLRYILSNSKMKLNQTIDVSTNDFKNIKVVNNKYDLRKLIKEVSLIIKKDIPENISFKTDIPNVIPELLYGESIKIKQILVTLLKNSFKYTVEGYVELRCNVIIKSDACRLIFTVEDTGCGMDLHEVNNILIGDADLDTNDLEKYNELDLNLKIVRKILKVIGGTLNIESTVNEGSKFIVTIDQRIVKNDNNINDIEKIEKQVFDKKNIAVVCDDNALSKKIIKVLDKVDAKKIECKHAKECIDKIRKDNNIDLIICQENMDKIDARELLKKVTKEEYNVPIIMVTNNSDYDLKRIKIEGFASGLSEKEISLDLVKKVERIINKEK